VEDLSARDRDIVLAHPGFEGDKTLTPVEWAAAWLKVPDEKALPADNTAEPEKGLSGEGRAKLEAKRAKLQKKMDARSQVLEGTNLGDAVRTAYDRESNNMLAGIIVISDGRSNQGSDQSFVEVTTRARKARVPIFTIGVGEERPRV